MSAQYKLSHSINKFNQQIYSLYYSYVNKEKIEIYID